MARIKRRLDWAAAAALVVLVLASLTTAFFVGQSWGIDSGSSNPTITEIQDLGELVVLRVHVADVLEKSSDEFKGVWIVRGDALVAVDMRLAEQQSADETAKVLSVLLPQPRVIQPRVDHEKTKTYDVSKKDWWNFFVEGSEEFSDQGMRDAQELVETTSAGEEVIAQARDQAELMLASMYRPVGWQVDVVWQE